MTTPTKVTFGKSIGFRKELNRRVEAYMEAENIAPRDNLAMYLKTVVIFSWLISAWTFTVFGPPVLWMKLLGCVALGLAVAGVGFSVGHDANHGGYSNSKLVNRLIGLSYDFIGLSSYLWQFRHNTLHHIYPNMLGYDIEIHADALVRLSPDIQYKWHHKYQHILIWFLYPFIPFYWSAADVYLILVKLKYQEHEIPKPSTVELITLLAFKLVWLGWLVAIPIAVGYSPLEAILGFALTYMTYGAVIFVIFMLAHVMDGLEFIKPNEEFNSLEDEWAVWQLKTTADFAPKNLFLNWYLGGLNYQAVHHLFPHICHIHYPKIAKIVAEVCEEFGVNYQVYDTFWDALSSHYRWLKKLGVAPAPNYSHQLN
ncbi:MAG: acyl-CoA desaturase [Oscillatoria sp. SIO1A7]|nr:acyl-CoA desaturase [Oscillatoria sp. SIO1A7]